MTQIFGLVHGLWNMRIINNLPIFQVSRSPCLQNQSVGREEPRENGRIMKGIHVTCVRIMTCHRNQIYLGPWSTCTNSRTPEHITCLGCNCGRFSNPTLCTHCSSANQVVVREQAMGKPNSTRDRTSSELELSAHLVSDLAHWFGRGRSPDTALLHHLCSMAEQVTGSQRQSWSLALTRAHSVALRIPRCTHFSAQHKRLSSCSLLVCRGRAEASTVLQRQTGL